MSSFEFNEHTRLLYDTLCKFLEDNDVEFAPGQKMASGLLKLRPDGNHAEFHPRLVVVSGIASLIARAIGKAVRDDLVVIGATREDDPTATMGKIYATCPGTAKDVLKNEDLEEGDIARLGHSVLSARPENLTAERAGFYFVRLYEKLNEL